MNKEAVENLCKQLRLRAGRLRMAAVGTFLLILCALAGGLYLFIYAGQISVRETISAFLDREGEKIERTLQDSYLSIEALIMRTDRPPEEYYGPIVEQLDALNVSVRTTGQRLADLPSVFSSEQSLPTQTLISTIVTRIGAVLLLVFLVQILVTLFKYNTRLASYYDARADALELVGDGKEQDLERIAAIFASESVDFGHTPSSPAQYAVELAKEILSSSKRQGVGPG